VVDPTNLAIQITDEEAQELLTLASLIENHLPDYAENLRRIVTRLVDPPCPIYKYVYGYGPYDATALSRPYPKIGSFIPYQMVANIRYNTATYNIVLEGSIPFHSLEKHYADYAQTVPTLRLSNPLDT
jgi:hypothetical protein